MADAWRQKSSLSKGATQNASNKDGIIGAPAPSAGGADNKQIRKEKMLHTVPHT